VGTSVEHTGMRDPRGRGADPQVALDSREAADRSRDAAGARLRSGDRASPWHQREPGVCVATTIPARRFRGRLWKWNPGGGDCASSDRGTATGSGIAPHHRTQFSGVGSAADRDRAGRRSRGEDLGYQFRDAASAHSRFDATMLSIPAGIRIWLFVKRQEMGLSPGVVRSEKAPHRITTRWCVRPVRLADGSIPFHASAGRYRRVPSGCRRGRCFGEPPPAPTNAVTCCGGTSN